MNNTILNDTTVTYYAIKVNGQVLPLKYDNSFFAEQAKQQLPDNQKVLAEVVPVTADGKEVLLG